MLNKKFTQRTLGVLVSACDTKASKGQNPGVEKVIGAIKPLWFSRGQPIVDNNLLPKRGADIFEQQIKGCKQRIDIALSKHSCLIFNLWSPNYSTLGMETSEEDGGKESVKLFPVTVGIDDELKFWRLWSVCHSIIRDDEEIILLDL